MASGGLWKFGSKVRSFGDTWPKNEPFLHQQCIAKPTQWVDGSDSFDIRHTKLWLSEFLFPSIFKEVPSWSCFTNGFGHVWQRLIATGGGLQIQTQKYLSDFVPQMQTHCKQTTAKRYCNSKKQFFLCLCAHFPAILKVKVEIKRVGNLKAVSAPDTVLLSLQDNRWPVSLWERRKGVRQEESQEEAGDWDRKDDSERQRRQLHEQGEAFNKKCNREKLGETERERVRQTWKDTWRVRGREESSGKQHLFMLSGCVGVIWRKYSMMLQWHTTPQTNVGVYFSLAQILMKEAHMSHTCHP